MNKTVFTATDKNGREHRQLSGTRVYTHAIIGGVPHKNDTPGVFRWSQSRKAAEAGLKEARGYFTSPYIVETTSNPSAFNYLSGGA
jgi:hypothetical protein